MPQNKGDAVPARAAPASAAEPVPVSGKADIAIAGYTPGPWSFDGPADNLIVWGGRDARVCFLTSTGPTEANARLIAAAPVLVEALQEAVAAVETGNLYNTMCCSGADCGCWGASNADLLVDGLRTVLTLALGEQS